MAKQRELHEIRSMRTFSVGQLYDPDRTTWRECGDFNRRGGGYDMRLFWANVVEQEIADVKSKTSEFAFLEEGPVLLLLYKYGTSPWSDTGCSWHQTARAMPEEAGPAPVFEVPEERVLLQTMLIDAATGIIKVISFKTWSPEFSRAFAAAMERNRLAPYPGDDAYNEAVAALYRKYPTTEDMVRAATFRCKGGE